MGKKFEGCVILCTPRVSGSDWTGEGRVSIRMVRVKEGDDT